jgi:hypothetical protein
VAPEMGKLNLSSASVDVLPRLRDLARTCGLPEADIELHPIVQTNERQKLPRFVWFSQVVRPSQFGSVFPRAFPDPGDQRPVTKKTWSDLISFWGGGDSAVFALDVETSVGPDVRRWYLVVALAGENVEVLYQGMV